MNNLVNNDDDDDDDDDNDNITSDSSNNENSSVDNSESDDECDEEYGEDDIKYFKEYNHLNINSFNLIDGLHYYKNQLRILDSSLKISTITITCNMIVTYNIEKIGEFFRDFDDTLIAMHYIKLKY